MVGPCAVDKQTMKFSCKASSSTLSMISQQTKKLSDPIRFRDSKLNPEQIYGHFSDQILSPISSMFSCMDFKGQRPIIGTPGGDIGEFLLAYNCYLDLKKEDSSNFEQIKLDMSEFIIQYCDASRPFYKHTDAARIETLIRLLNVENFPKTRPLNDDVWFKALMDPELHGCGHLRSILTNSKSYQLQNSLAQDIVKAYYDLYWTEEYNSKMFLEVLPNPKKLNLESGLVIHEYRTTDGGSPAFTPFKNGCGVFSLNIDAQNVFRSKITAPFFIKKLNHSITKEEFLKIVSERAFEYWKATGGYLDIFNIPLIEIKDDGFIRT